MKIQINRRISNGNIYLLALTISLAVFLLLPTIMLITVWLSGSNVNQEINKIFTEFFQNQIITDEFYFLNIVADFVSKTALAIIMIVAFRNSFKYDLFQFGKKWNEYLKMIFLFAIIMFFTNIFVSLIYEAFGDTGASENQDLINKCLLGDVKYFMIIETILIAPIVEEMIFRKFMIGTMEEKFGWKPMTAVIIATLVFAYIHVAGGGIENFLYIFQYIPLAFIISYSYYKSDYNIFVPMAIHFINNSLSIILFFLQ